MDHIHGHNCFPRPGQQSAKVFFEDNRGTDMEKDNRGTNVEKYIKTSRLYTRMLWNNSLLEKNRTATPGIEPRSSKSVVNDVT